jgi:isocitrate/isopropylmalate dehydrogenase
MLVKVWIHLFKFTGCSVVADDVCVGGRTHRGQPWETSTEVAIFTRHGVERLIRFAYETARRRPKKHLTVVTKSNAQRNGMVMWDEIAAEVAKEFPDVTTEKMLVDAMTCRMVLQPASLDTIVATNLVSISGVQ